MRMVIWVVSLAVCLVTVTATAAEVEPPTPVYSDADDVEELGAILGKDLRRDYAKQRPGLGDEDHAYARFMYRRHAARTAAGVVLSTVIGPAAVGGTVYFGLAWKSYNEPDDDPENDGGLHGGPGPLVAWIAIPTFTLVCGVIAVAAIGGGIALWALYIGKAAALREFIHRDRESEPVSSRRGFSLSVAPFVTPDGSAGFGMAVTF